MQRFTTKTGHARDGYAHPLCAHKSVSMPTGPCARKKKKAPSLMWLMTLTKHPYEFNLNLDGKMIGADRQRHWGETINNNKMTRRYNNTMTQCHAMICIPPTDNRVLNKQLMVSLLASFNSTFQPDSVWSNSFEYKNLKQLLEANYTFIQQANSGTPSIIHGRHGWNPKAGWKWENNDSFFFLIFFFEMLTKEESRRVWKCLDLNGSCLLEIIVL